MPFAATWMDLEIILLSEESWIQKDKYMMSFICGIFKKWHKWTYLQNRNRLTDFKNKFMVTKGEMWVQFSSVAQSCLTLCDPMNHSMPDLPVHHQPPESTQTHVHRVGNAIQPTHPLSSPSPPAYLKRG